MIDKFFFFERNFPTKLSEDQQLGLDQIEPRQEAVSILILFNLDLATRNHKQHQVCVGAKVRVSFVGKTYPRVNKHI